MKNLLDYQKPAIRVGVGGWTFAPWRDNFYPSGLPQNQELKYASHQFNAIEINGTYYGLQKPSTFSNWYSETPDDFVFSLKAPRFSTNRRVLAEAGGSIHRFLDSGIKELSNKLGPIVWQFAPTKAFDPVDFEALLQLLPSNIDGLPLRHVLDVRHASFKNTTYLKLARRYQIATVFTASQDYPSFADVTGPFIYARIMHTHSSLAEGCTPHDLAQLAACAKQWQDGFEPAGLPRVEVAPIVAKQRDVFMFFIGGAKEKAPAAAMALRRNLS